METKIRLRLATLTKNALVLIGSILFGTLSVSGQTYGCNDPSACNYTTGGFDENSQCKFHDDSCLDGYHYDANCYCVLSIVGCTDDTACNYNENANVNAPCVVPNVCQECDLTNSLSLLSLDSDGDGVCDDDEIEGCNNQAACNYMVGVTDLVLCEMPDANTPCEKCGIQTLFGGEYVPAYRKMDSTFISVVDAETQNLVAVTDYWVQHGSYTLYVDDADEDGVCDGAEAVGCIDRNACNYNGALYLDADTTCIYPSDCGCDWSALNLGVSFPIDTLESGGAPFGTNLWDNGTGVAAPPMLPSECDCGMTLDVVGVCGGGCATDDIPVGGNDVCDADEVYGCMDVTKCNYSLTATVDQTSANNTASPCMELLGCGCGDDFPLDDNICNCDTDQTAQNQDLNNNHICDVNEVLGCIDETKCNFDPLANVQGSGVEYVCLDFDNCGVCGGDGIAAGDCDCDGNKVDAMDVCGGACSADIDNDDICDDVDPCLIAGQTADVCNVCHDPGFVFVMQECGCNPLPEDACECFEITTTADTLDFRIDYPVPGEACDGTCKFGEDENGMCIYISGAILTEQPKVTRRFLTETHAIIEQNPFSLEKWMANIDSLHTRMSVNLDDGSMFGFSDSLTMNKSIISNGTLKVLGNSDLGYVDITPDSVTIKTNLHVSGYARVVGSTFSDGGLQTTDIGMSGDLSVGGSLRADGYLDIGMSSFLHDSLTVGSHLLLGKRGAVQLDTTGLVTADSLILRDSGRIHGDLIVQQNSHLGGDLTVNTNSNIKGSLLVGDWLKVRNNAVDKFTVDPENGNVFTKGSLTVTGGTSLVSLGLSGSLTVNQNTTIEGGFHSRGASFLVGREASPDPQYAMVIDGSGGANMHGLKIKATTNATPSSSNNFITFVDGNNDIIGGIEGQTPYEATNYTEYLIELKAKTVASYTATIDAADQVRTAARLAIDVIVKTAQAVSVVIPGLGLTDSDVAEGVATGIATGKAAIEAGIEVAAAATAVNAVGEAAQALADYLSYYSSNSNILFTSGAADYAEWLERANHRDVFFPGEIVGVKGGQISKNTFDTDHLLIVSTNPIILGNLPNPDQKKYFEKIAFMGQVPVRVVGSVKKGDFIVPSGDFDGHGIAVSQENIRLDQIPDIVGVAWEDGSNDLLNVVNSSIGLNNNSQRQIVRAITEKLETMETSLQYELANQLDLFKTELAWNSTSKDKKGWFTKRQTKNANDYVDMDQLVKPNLSTAEGALSQPEPLTPIVTNPEPVQQVPLEYYEEELDEYMGNYLDAASQIRPEDIKATMEILTADFSDAVEGIQDGLNDNNHSIGSLPNGFTNPHVPEHLLESFSQASYAVVQIMTHPTNLEKGFKKHQNEFMNDLVALGVPTSVIADFQLSGPEKEELYAETRKQIVEAMLYAHPYMRPYINE